MSSSLKKQGDQHVEKALDDALDETFPASDPVAMTEPTGPAPVAAPPVERDLGRDERIRRRAYEIWARDGHPAGREVEHWGQAERDIDAEDQAKPRPGGDLPASARDLATGHS